MGEITKLEIQKRNKQKVNLFIDEEFVCGLTAESVVRARLKVGQELSENDLNEILSTSETEIAFSLACDYISRAMKTAKEMRTYLNKKGFSPVVVENVINKLKDYHYVDDDTYAKLYLNSNLTTKGKRRLQMELTQKGVNKNIIESSLEEIDQDLVSENCFMVATKYMKNKEINLNNLVKLQRHLISRGYDFDNINECLRKFKADIE